MQVGFLQETPGSRTARIARALTDAGHTCHLLTRNEPRMMADAFASITRWQTPHDYFRALCTPEMQACEVWHVHLGLLTEWLAPTAALYRTGKGPRIVLDARDLDSLTPGLVSCEQHGQVIREFVTAEELASFACAEGVLYVSEQCQQISRVLHHPPDQQALIYSYVTAAELPDLPAPHTRAGVVYAGHVEDAGGNDYRDWGASFGVFGQAWDFHCYPISTRATPEVVAAGYRLRGVKMHGILPESELLAELTRYRWALVGFDQAFPLGEVAAPNKLFEAVAAGCPVLVLNSKQAGELVERHGIGLVARDAAELVRLVAECSEERWLEMAARVAKLRHQWTQEAQRNRLESLYKKVCNRPLRRSEWLNSGQTVYDWRCSELVYWPIQLPEVAQR